MGVWEEVLKKRKGGPLHFCLIDPDKQDPTEAAKLAAKAEEFGSDAIMVGGSWGDAAGKRLDETISEIKKSVKLPVILFPGSAQQISEHADAIFFMSLFNSRSPQYIVEEQAKGSVYVHKFGIEPLSMAYLIVESESKTSAGWVGDVKAIPRDKPEIAAAYALTAKYFGMKLVYLEAGSGAKETVPPEMIGMVKKLIDDKMLLIVGGGIRDGKTSAEKVKAGADIIVTGTIGEDNLKKFRDVLKGIKG